MAAGLFHLAEADFDQASLRKTGWWLVDVSTAWCPPCRRLTPKLQELAPAYRGRIEFAHINPEEDGPDVAVHLQVRAFPTMVLYKDGVMTDRRVGDLPMSSLNKWLEEAIAGA